MAEGRVMGVRAEADAAASGGSRLSCGGWKGRERLIVGERGARDDEVMESAVDGVMSMLILLSACASCAASAAVGRLVTVVLVSVVLVVAAVGGALLMDGTALVLKRPLLCLPCVIHTIDCCVSAAAVRTAVCAELGPGVC